MKTKFKIEISKVSFRGVVEPAMVSREVIVDVHTMGCKYKATCGCRAIPEEESAFALLDGAIKAGWLYHKGRMKLVVQEEREHDN